jgi:hypothetical protein
VISIRYRSLRTGSARRRAHHKQNRINKMGTEGLNFDQTGSGPSLAEATAAVGDYFGLNARKRGTWARLFI